MTRERHEAVGLELAEAARRLRALLAAVPCRHYAPDLAAESRDLLRALANVRGTLAMDCALELGGHAAERLYYPDESDGAAAPGTKSLARLLADQRAAAETLGVPHAEWAEAMRKEERVEWAAGFDPASFRYVRETVSRDEPRRRGRPARHREFRVVGWTNLRGDARNNGAAGYFTRRVFWVKPYDPYPGSGAPSEAVDPLTVAPGAPGRLTRRAWGRARESEGVE
jgi:hypothetical protein